MDNLQQLILKHLRGELTTRDQADLDAWLAKSEDNRALFEEMNDPASIAEYMEQLSRFDENRAWEKIRAHRKQVTPATATIAPFTGKKWFRYTAAAAILLFVISGGIYYYLRPSSGRAVIAGNKTNSFDIGPGRDLAVLTLTDGRKIVLDSSSRGIIAKQGGTNVINLKGHLNYEEAAVHDKNAGVANAVVYNTIETGRGNQYQLLLPDGSKVWLNAASSLRFPTSFTGKERKVVLTGEGYFAITKDAQKPFIVSFGNTDVKVLGTEFNVMAYGDEPGGTQTTLIKGSVSLQSGQRQAQLIPGKMATVIDGSIKLKGDLDIEQIIAWKNGQISFNNADLKMVMRQISRWYDVDVKYEYPASLKHFGGLLDRTVNLSVVLDFLNENGIHTRMKGREITIVK